MSRNRLSVRWLPVAATVLASTRGVRAADPPAVYSEVDRPQFHFTSDKDWINDPNGLVYFDGEYHLFFQRYPGGTRPQGQTKAWGHAVSADLVHWKQLPDALTPDAAGGIWSGSAVVDTKNTSGLGKGGHPPLVAIYTLAKQPFSQHLAYSNDLGRTWTKPAEPVLENVNGLNRDPKVIWHEPSKQWVMALYLDQPSRYALFTSPNLRGWTPLQEVTLDHDAECPDFFPLPLDGSPLKLKWIFNGANARYVVGSFDGKAFTRETESIESELGANFYAAQTYSDIPSFDGRRIQIGWMRGDYHAGMPFNQNLSFPTVLTLHSTPRGPRLFRWPVREITALYGDAQTWPATDLPPDATLDLGAAGDLFDVETDLIVGTARQVTLTVRGWPITFEPEGAGGRLLCGGRRVPLWPHEGHLKLRVLVDRTSVEIFANDGETVLSDNFTPTPRTPPLTLRAVGGTAKIASLSVHALKSAWPTPGP